VDSALFTLLVGLKEHEGSLRGGGINGKAPRVVYAEVGEQGGLGASRPDCMQKGLEHRKSATT